jgi:hypothetical protein
MELGLDGNIFSRPYSKYKQLLSHSWFAVMWQYTSKYNVVVHMNPRHNLRPTRVGDIALIEIFIPGMATQVIFLRSSTE